LIARAQIAKCFGGFLDNKPCIAFASPDWSYLANIKV